MKLSLKGARVNAGFKQTEIAEKMGISPATLISWEKGKTEPKPSQLAMFCEIVGVTAEDIFLPGTVS